MARFMAPHGYISFDLDVILEHVVDEKKSEVASIIKDYIYDVSEESYEEGHESAYSTGVSDEWVYDEIPKGYYDEPVLQRAKKLGYVKPVTDYRQDLHQNRHLEANHHIDGPIGWEFCARC